MKLLASDLDGTILFHDKSLADAYYRDSDLEKIASFQKEGNLFGLCTGRDLAGIYRPKQDVVKYDFCILNSGALIIDKDENIIYKNMLSKALVQEILDYVKDPIVASFVSDKRYFMNITELNDWQSNVIDSLDEIKEDELSAFSFACKDSDEAKKYYDLIQAKYHDKIALYQNVECLDFVAIGCSKGTGIKKIQEYFNLDFQDINVIGDSFNDIPMFEACENAFTFNHVNDDVKSYAKYHVDDIRECIDIILKK